MKSLEYITSSEAPPGALSMMGYRATGLAEGTHLGVPSASLTFILSLDGPVVGADTAEDFAAGRTASADVVFASLHDRPTHIHQPKSQAGVQLQINPLAARALFGVPASELPSGMPTDADSRWLRHLHEHVGELPSWPERFAVVHGQLARRAADRTRLPRADLVMAWRTIHLSGGRATVEDVARHNCLSPRQLRVQFRREFGLSPKTVSRLVRFDRTLDRLAQVIRAGGRPNLAEIAHDAGYFDQAHLVRDCQQFLLTSPTEWIDRERRNIQAGGYANHAS